VKRDDRVKMCLSARGLPEREHPDSSKDAA
jgi:hypothetical protein